MKKIHALFLILSLLVFMFSLSSAEESGNQSFINSGEWQYRLLNDGTAELVRYLGTETNLILPEELDGKKVTGIWRDGFSAKYLISLEIPNSISDIDINPFDKCRGLTEIRVSPDHPYLVVINGALLSKKDNRLIWCPNVLTSYDIPQGTSSIGAKAFYNCFALTSVTIPDSIIEIGDQAFCNCTALTSVSIPDCVMKMGENPFSGCTSLAEIKVSPFHQYFSAIDCVLFSKIDKRLICCPPSLMLSSYNVPDGTLSIGKNAFYGCTSITSVSIPDSVISIEDFAFWNCKSLKSLTIPDNVTSLGIAVFNGCTSLTTVMLPDSITSIEYRTFSGCSSLVTVKVPSNIKSIGNSAFANCSALSSITIPEGVTDIEDNAFYDCSSLAFITIPDSISRIGENSFMGCSMLTVIVTPNSYAMQYCIENEIKYANLEN